MHVKILTAKTGKELEQKLDEFKANSYIPTMSDYDGGKRKVIKKTEIATNGNEFVMTVEYDIKFIPVS